MKVRDFLVQSCLIQKWEISVSDFCSPAPRAREEAVSVCVRAKTTTEHVHQKPAACLHDAAGWCELVFLSDAHCRQETAINYSIRWQTMSPLIDPNRIPSPRTHYAIDWAAIISRTGEPFLHARNS
jgi:hypothetical protein